MIANTASRTALCVAMRRAAHQVLDTPRVLEDHRFSRSSVRTADLSRRILRETLADVAIGAEVHRGLYGPWPLSGRRHWFAQTDVGGTGGSVTYDGWRSP